MTSTSPSLSPSPKPSPATTIRRIFRFAAWAIVAASVPAFAAPPPTIADPPTARPAFLSRQPANVQAGYALFVSKGCYLCHGHVGQGSPMSGPALLVAAPYEYLLHFVRQPRNQMPPYFPETLSDDDVHRIADYLQAIPPEKKSEAIPMLEAIQPR